MTDTEKLEAVLAELAKVYSLTSEYISFIKDNIVLRCVYYRKMNLNFDNETIYINNSSTIMDFFLNRILHNIRGYDVNKVYNPNNTEEEEYSIDNQRLKLSTQKVFGEIVTKKLQNRIENINDDLAKLIDKKIICHEFGHVFQTAYSGIIGKDDTKYKQVINNLHEKYPSTFIIPYYEQKLVIRQNGLIPTTIDDGKDGIREYYANKDRIVLIDDIFNEDEALELYRTHVIQGKNELGKDCYKNIFNYESTNYKITSYARMMKLILGNNKSFRTMYQNGIEFFEFFDQFDKLATEVFKNGTESKKPVVSCILDALERIKRNNSLVDTLNLDLFFTKCLEKRIKYFLKDNVTKDDIIEMKKIVNEFVIRLTKCKSGKLDHDFVIDNIKKMIDAY